MDLTLSLKLGRRPRKPRPPVADRVAQAAIALDDVTLSSAGTLAIVGLAGITLNDVALSSAATLAISGAAAITLDDITIVAEGAEASPLAEGTIDLFWDGNPEPLIPTFRAFDIPDPQVGDVIKLRRYVAGSYGSYDEAEATITSLAPVNPLVLDFGGNWPLGDYEGYALQYRSAVLINTSNLEPISITGDVTGPILSLPIDTAINGTTGTGGFTTTEPGTGYVVVQPFAMADPDENQIIDGLGGDGNPAAYADVEAVPAAGTFTFTDNFTPLTNGVQYKAHFVMVDDATPTPNVSNVVRGDGFGGSVAPTLTLGLGAATGTTTGSGGATTDDDSGTFYRIASTLASTPLDTQVEAGQMSNGAASPGAGSQPVSAVGAQTVTGGFTGLASDTVHYPFYMHKNATGLRSNVEPGPSFKTEYQGVGATFDGTNDWLKRGGDLTGAGSSKLLTFSCWYKSASDSASFRGIVVPASTLNGTGGLNGALLKMDTHALRIQWFNNAGTVILDLRSSANAMQIADGWVHVMGSVDLADTAKRHLFVDDVSDLSVVTYTNQNMEFASNIADWGIGGSPGGTSRMFGDLAELYFAPGQYIDFSVEANRRKFITSTGYPVNLGADGSTPTGVAPLIYLRGGASGFPTNLGSGGGFTLTGTLVDASTEAKL